MILDFFRENTRGHIQSVVLCYNGTAIDYIEFDNGLRCSLLDWGNDMELNNFKTLVRECENYV